MERLTVIFSYCIVLLAAIASSGGLFFPQIYRDSEKFVAIWRGNDLVTLVIAAPLLLWSLIFRAQFPKRTFIIWIAMLGYMIYNYAFYVFGAIFNVFFLLYVVLFALSVYTLILVFMRMDTLAIQRWFDSTLHTHRISLLLFSIGGLLGSMWISTIVISLVTNTIPLHLVFALDLSIIVPNMILGGILLWKKHPWGYILSSMMIIKGTTYTVALLVMQVFALRYIYDPLTPFYALFSLGCGAAAWYLLKHVKD